MSKWLEEWRSSIVNHKATGWAQQARPEVGAIMEELASMVRAHMHNQIAGFLRTTKSPIEEMFVLGILADAVPSGMPVKLNGFCLVGTASWDVPMDERIPILSIFSQPEIAGLHPDFAVGIARYGKNVWSAVECDGHDFHEKTKQQAARDKRRDRDLADAGYPVLRFTGSEIHGDPIERGRWMVAHLLRRIEGP